MGQKVLGTLVDKSRVRLLCSLCRLLGMRSWPSPGRFVSPKGAVLLWGGGGTVASLPLASSAFSCCDLDWFYSLTKSSFLSFSFHLTLWPPVRFSLPVLHPLLG